jgi:tetratricopeptide (TPR) repeat protein
MLCAKKLNQWWNGDVEIMIKTLFKVILTMRKIIGIIKKRDNYCILVLFFLFSFWLSTDLANADDENIKILMNQAKICLSNKNIKCSLQKINRAIFLSPNNIDCYRFRAKIWIGLKDYQNAIKDYTKILNIKPSQYPHIYYLRGDCFTELGFFKQGIMDYSKCLKHFPNDGKVWYYRARAFALSGKFANALKDINRGLATGTHHANSLIKLREAIILGKPIPYHAPASN